MKSKKDTKKIKKLTGVVVSDKMDKTIVVKVDRLKTHRLYKKKYKVSKRYKVHDPKNTFKVKDKVVISETRPISREKRWLVVSNEEKKK